MSDDIALIDVCSNMYRLKNPLRILRGILVALLSITEQRQKINDNLNQYMCVLGKDGSFSCQAHIFNKRRREKERHQ